MIPKHLMAAHVPPVIKVDPSASPNSSATLTVLLCIPFFRSSGSHLRLRIQAQVPRVIVKTKFSTMSRQIDDDDYYAIPYSYLRFYSYYIFEISVKGKTVDN